MRFGDLKCLVNGTVSCSWCYFVQIQPISHKFNSCVVRLTNRRTDTPAYRLQRCENASKNKEISPPVYTFESVCCKGAGRPLRPVNARKSTREHVDTCSLLIHTRAVFIIKILQGIKTLRERKKIQGQSGVEIRLASLF